MSRGIQAFTPQGFADYELIDSGGFLKLERFGQYVTIRPEPQAVWDSTLSMPEWEMMAHVRFEPKSSSSGNWVKLKKNMPDQWQIKYAIQSIESKEIAFRLGLTSFKHVGIFPEQAVNWEFIADSVARMPKQPARFLNLFAYTGGASLAARAAGAETLHLDSIKQVVNWANENQQLSGLKDIRWVVEDALKFARREVKRGNKYNGIILDPPAFGHGPNGEKWKLEDQINEMVKLVLELLDDQYHFLILNAYSLGFSSLILENLLQSGDKKRKVEIGELYLEDRFSKRLPLGAFGRLRNF
ncbi:MAG: class I SAM-dependent methyltransferase [Chitinophagales bacterium]|nr:class I SAM-dependent methyltransferase [Chitinophagales bacterium]